MAEHLMIFDDISRTLKTTFYAMFFLDFFQCF